MTKSGPKKIKDESVLWN